MLLNRAKKYYHDNKEILRKKARNKYRELSDEHKNKKREYGRNRYNMSDEDKQKLKKYPKTYSESMKRTKNFYLYFFIS